MQRGTPINDGRRYGCPMDDAAMKKQRQDLTEGSIVKKLLLFALPLLGSSLIQQLYNTVDVFFAGNFITGGNAMAAVGASSMIVTLLVGFFNGMSVGSGVAVSHAFGGNHPQKLSRAVHTAVGVSLAGGVLVSVLGFFISPTLLVWMQTPADILEMASSYIQVYFLSMLSLITYNILTGVLRAVGDSRSPLLYQCVGGVLNVILDYVFIVAGGMGVMGVAVATLISQTVPAVCVFVHLMAVKKPYRIVLKKIRIHRDVLGKILKIGVPSGVQSIVLTLSNLVVQSQINGLGTDTIGAFTVYFKVELIMYLPIVAFGQAITTFVGQNCGAEKFHRVSRGIHTCLLMGIGVTVLTSGFVLLFAPQCYALFGATSVETELGCRILLINAPLYFLYNFLEVYSRALCGSGNATIPMLISIGNMCGIRIAALFLLVLVFHSVEAVALCYPITWFTTSVSMMVYYCLSPLRKQIKRHKAMPHPIHGAVPEPAAAPPDRAGQPCRIDTASPPLQGDS